MEQILAIMFFLGVIAFLITGISAANPNETKKSKKTEDTMRAIFILGLASSVIGAIGLFIIWFLP